jgi:uncharacterized OB-fold protein
MIPAPIIAGPAGRKGMRVATSGKSRAIDPNLFTWPSAQPSLLASCCRECEALAFPANPSCTRCGSTDVERIELPRRGTLWTWTIQRFMPKEPYASSETEASFKPFGVGYVELPGAIRIETRLTVGDPKQLKIGEEMELVIYPHRIEQDGTAVMNYAFAPRSAAP